MSGIKRLERPLRVGLRRSSSVSGRPVSVTYRLRASGRFRPGV